MTGTVDQTLVLQCLAGSISALSLLCSALNIALIRSLNQWNGFLAILFYMAICQIIYDSAFYLDLNGNFNHSLASLWGFIEDFGGLSVAFWTNALSFIIIYVVVGRNRMHVLAHIYSFSFAVLFPALAISSLGLIFGLTDDYEGVKAMEAIYYWTRIASIVVNFVVMLYVLQTVRQQRHGVADSSNAKAHFILSRRMMYYPLMQLITRLPAAVYEELYGFGSLDEHSPTNVFIAKCFFEATQSASGIGFLIIFLIFQPRAWEHFKFFLRHGKYKTVATTDLGINETPVLSPFSTATGPEDSEFKTALTAEQQNGKREIDFDRPSTIHMEDMEEEALLAVIWERRDVEDALRPSSAAIPSSTTNSLRTSIDS